MFNLNNLSETLIKSNENNTFNNNYIPYIIMYSIAGIGGFFGNILIIGSIIFTKELHNLACLIIANLAFADFISNNISNLFSLIGKYMYKKFVI